MNPEEFRKQQARIASRAQSHVQRVHAVQDRLSTDEMVAMMSSGIAAANLGAWTLADRFVGALIWTPPRPSLWPSFIPQPENEEARLEQVLSSVVVQAPDDQLLPRIERIARSEPEQAGRQGAQRGMAIRSVSHYRWELDPDPCDQCRELAARTYSVDEDPDTHPNCSCQIVPERNPA